MLCPKSRAILREGVHQAVGGRSLEERHTVVGALALYALLPVTAVVLTKCTYNKEAASMTSQSRTVLPVSGRLRPRESKIYLSHRHGRQACNRKTATEL
jgi:hypothetical protein